jgi:hypothetical protein
VADVVGADYMTEPRQNETAHPGKGAPPSRPARRLSPLARAEEPSAYAYPHRMTTTTIPLEQHQLEVLLRLAFEWDMSPRDTLDRVLQEAYARHLSG